MVGCVARILPTMRCSSATSVCLESEIYAGMSKHACFCARSYLKNDEQRAAVRSKYPVVVKKPTEEPPVAAAAATAAATSPAPPATTTSKH